MKQINNQYWGFENPRK